MEELEPSDYHALGQFRHSIRHFLHFSEEAARAEGLEPQQHQLMLAIRAWEEVHRSPQAPTIGLLADHLLLKHHSAVGLVDRLEERGLVERVRSKEDRRQVNVHLTGAGIDKLRRLASAHREELRSSGPMLVKALSALLRGRGGDGKAE